MPCNDAGKHFVNYALGLKVEFVEFIGRCSIKSGSGTICKQLH